MLDRTRKARRATEESIGSFLAKQDLGGELVGITMEATSRKAGLSSGTELFDADIRKADGSIERKGLVLRFDMGALFAQYDLQAQFEVMREVAKRGLPVPQALWFDGKGEMAQSAGMIMERVDAPAPSSEPFKTGPIADAEPAVRHEMILNMMRELGCLHSLPASELDIPRLRARGKGETYIDREIDWMTVEWNQAAPASADSSRKAFYDDQRELLFRVRDRLIATAPRHREPEIVHGDPMVANFMFDGPRVAAMLDWELTHLGIGEQDIFYSLAGNAYFTLFTGKIEGVPSEEECVAAYTASRGKFEDGEYARLFAEWRVAMQTAMFHRRLPDDMRHLEIAYWENCERRLKSALG